MNVVTLGIRNAFRNMVRTFSIVVILGLIIGLSLIMLIANQAVSKKIESVKQSIGNTITIRPAGYSGFSRANNGLTVAQLDKISQLPHVTKLAESLNGHLVTKGSQSPMPPGLVNKMSGSFGETSLASPIKLNKDGNGASGGGLVISDGNGEAPKDFSPPVEMLGTTDPMGTMPQDSSNITISNGNAIDGTKDKDEALISESMASKNSLAVGSTFTAYDKTLTVAGIFKSSTQASDNIVILSLAALERLSGNAGAVTLAVATVDSVSNIDSVTAAVKSSLGSSADATSSKDTVQNAIKPLQDIQNVSSASLVGSVAAGGVIILLTMIMIVRERKREIGVIKAIGSSNLRIMFQFMAEALTLTILGLAIGLVVGVVGGSPVTKTLVDSSANSSMRSNLPSSPGGGAHLRKSFVMEGPIKAIQDVRAEIGWDIILYGLGAAILIALFGSALASFFIAKVKPAEVLRSE
jgi:putative ABC transport system permease protein